MHDLGRNAESIFEDIKYIVDHYSSSEAILRYEGKTVFYVYDSYHLSEDQWSRLLSKSGDFTLRSDLLDGYFLGLWLDRQHGEELYRSNFDGLFLI